MIYLVGYFLLRARPKIVLLVGLGALVWFVSFSSYFKLALFSPLMFVVCYGTCMAVPTVEAEEFDLVLPVRRRTLYLARNLAVALLVIIMIAPVSVAALLFVGFHGFLGEELLSCATFALWLVALPVITASLMRFAKRMPSPLTVSQTTMVLMVVLFVVAVTSERRISNLLPAGAAALATALAWFLGRWQFERYELVPSGDAGPAQVAVARSGLMDRFSPMVRVLAHAVWLRWWYPVVVVFAAWYCFMFTAWKWRDAWVFYLMYAGCGGGIIQLLGGTGQSLLPYVSRRTILRSVLAPIAATPLLIGVIKAIATDSAPMILCGLAISLLTVGMTWFALPSAKEYGRPFRVGLRRNLSLIPCLGFFACAFVPAFKNFIGALLAISWSHAAPWFDGKPVLASCVIVLAIALLSWRCERKFRYFEPFAMPSSFRNAA